MAVELTCGADGGTYDYSTVNALIAGINAYNSGTLDDDMIGTIHPGAAGTLLWTTSAPYTLFSVALAGHSLTIRGSEGSVADRTTQICLYNDTSDYVYNFILYAQYGVIFENLYLTAASGLKVINMDYYGVLLYRCTVEATAATAITMRFGTYIECVIESTAYCIDSTVTNSPNIINCLVVSGTNALYNNRNSGVIIGSTIVSTASVAVYNINQFQCVRDSIIYGSTYALTGGVPSPTVSAWYMHTFQNISFYSGSDSTKVASGVTIDQFFFLVDPASKRIQLEDPLFVASGTNIIDYYALQATSPCLARNQTPISNTIWPTRAFDRVTRGAFNGYAGSGVLTGIRDDAAITDVRAGVVYAANEKTGNMPLPLPSEVLKDVTYG